MTATLTTTELAAQLSTTPRTLRKFLRNQAMGVGKGSRYALPATKREISSLNKKFIAWGADEAKKAEARNAAKTVEAVDEVDSDNDDTEPTDAELAEIDE